MRDDCTHGIIRTLVADRGFGFITAPDRPDTFFHLHDVAGGRAGFLELHVGQAVMFELDVNGERGPRARNVIAR